MSATDREADIVPAISYFEIPDFAFEDGTRLTVRLAYVSLNPSSNKKALIPTCYGGRLATTHTFSSSPSSSLSDHHIIVVAMLGNGESSSPSNTADFPKSLDYRDQIRAQQRLVTEHFGITRLDAVIGFSMGGQQAYYWAAMYPDLVANAVCVCGSARTSAHNYAFLEGPFNALLASKEYDGGRYRANGLEKPEAALKAFGRAYAGWLYSADWFREGKWQETTGAKTMAEYMDKADGSWLVWDPEDLLILGRQWQKADVGVVGGGFEKTLEGLKSRVLVMPCSTDQYFRPEDSEIEMKYLKNAELAIIPSSWGHAAGGGSSQEDNLWMDKALSNFLAKSK